MEEFRLTVLNESGGANTSVLESRAELVGREEGFDLVLTIHRDAIYVNLPANPLAERFIDVLRKMLGEPSMSPTIKCSAPWGEGMMGPMQTVGFKPAAGELERFKNWMRGPF